VESFNGAGRLLWGHGLTFSFDPLYWPAVLANDYRPRHWRLSLALAGGGLLILATFVVASFRRAGSGAVQTEPCS
jgi:hypothetical protein